MADARRTMAPTAFLTSRCRNCGEMAKKKKKKRECEGTKSLCFRLREITSEKNSANQKKAMLSKRVSTNRKRRKKKKKRTSFFSGSSRSTI